MVCAKVREGDKRIVRLKEGNPAGCHVVIVDDLVQSGGTLIECQVFLYFFPFSEKALLSLCYINWTSFSRAHSAVPRSF